jgi:hypothetical protein
MPKNGLPPLALGRILRTVAWIIPLLLLNKGGNAGAGTFFAILAIMALTSPQGAFKALAICFLGLMMNVAYVPKELVWTWARLILPALALLRFLNDLSRTRTSFAAQPKYVALLVYCLVMVVCSVSSGWFTQIALLKLFNFLLVVSAVFAGVTVLRARRIDMTEFFVSLISVATLLGLASIPLGYSNAFYRGNMHMANVFIGAFMHPNCHTLYGSLFTGFLASLATLGSYRNRWLALPLIMAWVFFMVSSQARSAIVATGVGLIVLTYYARPLANASGWRLRVNLSRGTLTGIGILAVALLAFWNLATQGTVSRAIVAFINKTEEDTETLDAGLIVGSRAGLIEQSWANFRENPLLGIGFQVAKTEAFARSATLFTAPAEKGFLPTAVLEEGGVVGATAFLIFLIFFLRELSRERNVPGMAGLLTFLATNMGEVSIFSPGGPGAFGWVMVGAAMILGDYCWVRPPAALYRFNPFGRPAQAA